MYAKNYKWSFSFPLSVCFKLTLEPKTVDIDFYFVQMRNKDYTVNKCVVKKKSKPFYYLSTFMELRRYFGYENGQHKQNPRLFFFSFRRILKRMDILDIYWFKVTNKTPAAVYRESTASTAAWYEENSELFSEIIKISVLYTEYDKNIKLCFYFTYKRIS